MAEKVWTTGRKWMGNLIPLICMLPLVSVGVAVMIRAHEPTVFGGLLCLGGLIVGWFAVNQFGFFGNAAMRRELQRKLLAKANKDASKAVFVGFARPSYVGLLDAHEDLGFLFLEPEKLEFVGETHRVQIQKRDVLGSRFKGNVHSVLGLGRWVAVDAHVGGKMVRLLVEPREGATLLANRRRGTELRKQIDDWHRS